VAGPVATTADAERPNLWIDNAPYFSVFVTSSCSTIARAWDLTSQILSAGLDLSIFVGDQQKVGSFRNSKLLRFHLKADDPTDNVHIAKRTQTARLLHYVKQVSRVLVHPIRGSLAGFGHVVQQSIC
jgi:hypothetical protein